MGIEASNTAAHRSSVIPPDQWVDVFGDALYEYAVVRVGDEILAEDMVQETFLAAIKAYGQGEGVREQLFWLRKILKNKIYEFYRTQSRRRGLLVEFGKSMRDSEFFDEQGNWIAGRQPAPPPSVGLEYQEVWGVVKDCLKQLPNGFASVFVMSVVDGLETQRICQELEISKENFWTRMHRARVSLASCVGSKLESAN